MYKDFLARFFLEYGYSEEGASALLNALDTALGNPIFAKALLGAVDNYASLSPVTPEPIAPMLESVRAAALGSGVSSETVDLLFFLLCMKPLKQRYQDAGLPLSYYDGIAFDLRSKLNECRRLKGIWGTFVAGWFYRFFSLGRFVMGRLQYERIPLPEAYCPHSMAHMAGQDVVNVHIPSGRPLIRDEVRASLAEAAAFYAPHFPNGQVIFVCHSWLLFPGHLEMLPENSGIRQFMEEFTVFDSFDDPQGRDLWRIFYREDVTDPDALPQETSLQRAYVKWLQDGKAVGGGAGIRIIQG